MKRFIICTVGTSLLTNRDERPWSGWHPRTSQELPEKNEVEAWLKTSDPEKASAETNTLRALKINPTDRLALLHSATKEGRFCAEALKTLYEKKCRSVVLKEIGQLGYGAQEFTKGLKALVNTAIDLVKKAHDEGLEPVFCATGGFKAEIAFLNLLGALLGIEVVYIHELHRRIVRLPRLPLRWDADFVEQHKDFFEWIDEEPRPTGEVQSWLKARPQLRSLVEKGEDGCTYLSAAGNLLYKAAKEQVRSKPRAYWPEPCPMPPQKKNKLSGEPHHRPKGWKKFVERLCSMDCVEAVSYNEQAYGGPKVKILDPHKGLLALRYGPTGEELPLEVKTTARNKEECELVASCLRQLKLQ